MPKVSKSQLQSALVRELKLAQPVFRLESNGARVSGSVVSETFRGKKDHERQRMIWDALEKVYGPASVKLVGMLLAYTPEEWDADAKVVSAT